MSERETVTRRGFVARCMTAGTALAAGISRAGTARASAQDAAPPPVADRIPGEVKPFPLADVRLGPGPFLDALEANRRYLDSLDPDRLLHTFRLNAGLPSAAEPVGGWEKPDCELRGHFGGGHYLSALALLHSATGEDVYRRKADAMVAELARCQ